jgi:[ribosomal protein S5]-alanine N-acetyltransferase
MYPALIDGERIQLRDFESTDLDAMTAISGDPEVTSYLSFDTRTRDQQARLLAADIERAQADPRPDYYLAIIEKSTGLLVGFVRIGLMAHSAGELGYAMRKDRWRHGYTAEASAMMLDFAFTTLGLHRVQAACGPENTGSQALLEKLGFTREGQLRDHVFTNGAWRDSLLYSILGREWHSTSYGIDLSA